MINLSNLKKSPGAKKREKIVGRGNASGHGTFSGHGGGTKGQRSRRSMSGRLRRLGMRRLILSAPKLRGFRSLQAKPVAINLDQLEKVFKAGDTVTPQQVLKKGLIRNLNRPIKILGAGELKKSLIISGFKVSGAAAETIKKAGGKIVEKTAQAAKTKRK